MAAALGGASRTVSVDASAAALERGRENLAHAGVLDGAAHAFVNTAALLHSFEMTLPEGEILATE